MGKQTSNCADPRANILLVDDDLEVLKFLTEILEHAGFKVIPCASAQDADCEWESARERIDLIVSDVVMPGGRNGLELVRDLRQDKAVPVIFISGNSPDMFENQELLEQGVFLQKPFTPSKLTALVRKTLGRSE